MWNLCIILFSFKQFLRHDFVLYGAENISVYVEGCNCKISMPKKKNPVARHYDKSGFKNPYFKG